MTAPSAARTALVTVASVVVALLICALVFVLAGQSPAEVYGTMLRGTLGDPTGLAEVGRRTIPLLLNQVKHQRSAHTLKAFPSFFHTCSIPWHEAECCDREIGQVNLLRGRPIHSLKHLRNDLFHSLDLVF